MTDGAASRQDAGRGAELAGGVAALGERVERLCAEAAEIRALLARLDAALAAAPARPGPEHRAVTPALRSAVALAVSGRTRAEALGELRLRYDGAELEAVLDDVYGRESADRGGATPPA